MDDEFVLGSDDDEVELFGSKETELRVILPEKSNPSTTTGVSNPEVQTSEQERPRPRPLYLKNKLPGNVPADASTSATSMPAVSVNIGSSKVVDAPLPESASIADRAKTRTRRTAPKSYAFVDVLDLADDDDDTPSSKQENTNPGQSIPAIAVLPDPDESTIEFGPLGSSPPPTSGKSDRRASFDERDELCQSPPAFFPTPSALLSPAPKARKSRKRSIDDDHENDCVDVEDSGVVIDPPKSRKKIKKGDGALPKEMAKTRRKSGQAKDRRKVTRDAHESKARRNKTTDVEFKSAEYILDSGDEAMNGFSVSDLTPSMSVQEEAPPHEHHPSLQSLPLSSHPPSRTSPALSHFRPGAFAPDIHGLESSLPNFAVPDPPSSPIPSALDSPRRHKAARVAARHPGGDDPDEGSSSSAERKSVELSGDGNKNGRSKKGAAQTRGKSKRKLSKKKVVDSIEEGVEIENDEGVGSESEPAPKPLRRAKIVDSDDDGDEGQSARDGKATSASLVNDEGAPTRLSKRHCVLDNDDEEIVSNEKKRKAGKRSSEPDIDDETTPSVDGTTAVPKGNRKPPFSPTNHTSPSTSTPKRPSLTSRYTIASRTDSTPMAELIRRANSRVNSPFPAVLSRVGLSRAGTASGGTPTRSTAYTPYLKMSRSALSRIAPLHPNRHTPPPPPPRPPPKPKTKKEREQEEAWEEELIESVGGVSEWACMTDAERAEARRAKRERETII